MERQIRQGGAEEGERIVAVDCFAVRTQMTKPVVTATHHASFGDALFVRLRTRDGAEGWGESGADVIMAGETLAGMRAMVEQHLAPRVIGRSPFERVACADEFRVIFANGGAKAAIDMAMLDLAGRLRGVPAVELLGGAARQRVKVLRLIGGSRNLDEDVAEAAALRGLGYTAFKLKVGITTVERDAQTVRALRDALGAQVMLAADANMAWGVAETRRFLGLVDDCNLAFLEQPVAAGDHRRLVAAGAHSSISIGADESVHGLNDVLTLARESAAEGISLKSAKFGGPTRVCEAGFVADALGLSVNVAMLAESRLASAAMLHTSCALPRIDWGLSLGCLWLADDPTVGTIDVRDGDAHLGTKPGLGIEVDEAELLRLAVH